MNISKLEISKYYIIFVYFQAAVSALLAVSVLYVEKNQNKILRNISRFLTSNFRQIAFLMTCQQHQTNLLEPRHFEQSLGKVVESEAWRPILDPGENVVQDLRSSGRGQVTRFAVNCTHSTLLDYQILQKIVLAKSAQTFSDILDEFITYT